MNGGTRAIAITSAGRVGVGSTTPYAKLSVGGDLVVGAPTAGGTNGNLFLNQLATPAGAFLAVNASGQVIATTSPSGGGISAVTGTYPVISSGGATPAISLAFGTTTANTWSLGQTFTLAPTISALTSALVQTDGAGLTSEYAGTSCTNQFVRSLSALGVATCATVANTDLANSTISGIALGSNLADLTATNSTLTFSGSYNGGAARTVGLNLGNANTWTSLQQFNANASTTGFTNSGTTWFSALATPAGAFLAVDGTGRLIATTSPSGGGGTPGGTGTELQYRAGASTFGAIANTAVDAGLGLIGFGSTTPWGLVSIASSTWNDYTRPLFSVATSSDTSGQLFSVFATSSPGRQALTGLFASYFSGARVIIGSTLDHLGRQIQAFTNLRINGSYDSSWQNSFCDGFILPGTISADDPNVCGGFVAFDETSVATLSTTVSDGSASGLYGTTMALTSGVAANAGTLLFGLPKPSSAAVAFASTTPQMEVIAGAYQNTSSTTYAYIGFGLLTPGTLSLPSSTLGFMATSTENWVAVCDQSTSDLVVDTGIATSTAAVKFRVEADGTKANLYAKTSLHGDWTYALSCPNIVYSAHSVMYAGVRVGQVSGGTAIAPQINVFSIRYWRQTPWNWIP